MRRVFRTVTQESLIPLLLDAWDSDHSAIKLFKEGVLPFALS